MVRQAGEPLGLLQPEVPEGVGGAVNKNKIGIMETLVTIISPALALAIFLLLLSLEVRDIKAQLWPRSSNGRAALS